jgi:hypothetical protein
MKIKLFHKDQGNFKGFFWLLKKTLENDDVQIFCTARVERKDGRKTIFTWDNKTDSVTFAKIK